MRARTRSPHHQVHTRRHRLDVCLKLALYAVWPAVMVWVLLANWRAPSPAAGSPGQSIVAGAMSAASGAAGKAALSQAALLVQQQGVSSVLSAGPLVVSRRNRAMSEGGGQQLQQQEAGETGTVQGSAQSLRQSGQGGQQPQQLDGKQVESRAKVHAPASVPGEAARYYYSFHNVQLTRERLAFFMPPGFRAAKNHWVDAAASNATHPGLPSMLVFRGDNSSANWTTLPVTYLASSAGPAKCRGWIDKPTYLLVRSRGWDEVTGAFQMLREQGALPLVQVDANANMREVHEGLGAACPVVYDPKKKSMGPDNSCLPTAGVVQAHTCDQKNQAWCRPGVWSYHRPNGPLILSFEAQGEKTMWEAFYSAITDDLRDLSQVTGFCFRHLIIGRTATLDFNRAASTTAAHAQRAEATAVFKAFASTAQQEQLRLRMLPHEKLRFKGYKDEVWERLRKGIGPEEIQLASIITPKEMPGMALQIAAKVKEEWAWKQKAKKKAKGLAKLEMEAVNVLDVAAAEGTDPNKIMATVGANPHTLAGRMLLAAAEVEGVAAGGNAAAAGGADSKPRAAHGAVPRRGAGGHSSQHGGEAGGEFNPETDGEGSTAEPDGEPALSAMPPLMLKVDPPLELPRPVVTYMARPNFERGVLNEQDILRYILKRYNVTLRVTLLQEPLADVMELMQHSDVLIGMYSSGWANGLLIKQGASAVQMYPYGWRLPSGQPIPGSKYKEILLASNSKCFEWYNNNSQHAFFRREDFRKNKRGQAPLHPLPDEPVPSDGGPEKWWVYQNTYVDMASFGPVIEQAMAAAGIQPMLQQPMQVGQQKAQQAAKSGVE